MSEVAPIVVSTGLQKELEMECSEPIRAPKSLQAYQRRHSIDESTDDTM